MNCPRCEHENPVGVKFCGECGARLESLCPACRASNPPANKFCHDCGAPLTGSSQVEKFASPQAYTPKHLAEKILTSRSALEGERKQVTVLFADLKGSMELLADRDPEEARKLLDPVLERMMEAVHRYEGTVNQVLGDGIMALFGAPLAHEDHAVRACYAALQIHEAVGRYAEELRRSHGLDVQIRVGLNSGEVVVRSIGSDLHMDYTAVGQTTHLAARMEQLARPGTTLVTGDTLRLAEGYIEVKPLGPVPVKGLTDPTEIYEILRAGPVRSRLQATAARGFTRFVGRDAELEQLRQALDKARAGHGQVVALVGEPGVGKSRLFWEFTHSHRTQGWLLLESGSVSYGKATPYLPVIDLLTSYFQIEARDDARKIREKLTGKLLTLDESLRPTLPAFLALLDAPVEEPQWQALDPPQRRQRTLDACKHLLLRESQVQPLCLVFEDLHWIDSETQAFLDSMIESLPTARLLLLVNYRPEYQHGWGSKTYYTQLRIDPLPPESCEELLQALLGDGASLQPLKQLLIERTEGNPFFLEESVRTLLETQVLVGERGAYRLAKALPSIQVPATVQAVLAARIDRLPPQEKTLLQTASVVGKDVPFALLHAIAELSEEELRRGLTHLQAAEFLYEASLFPELEYTFKHALTHDVAYGSLLQERRRALHGRIAAAIERLYRDRLAEHVERLGDHAFRGEVWERAVVYLRQAGAKAMSAAAFREAATQFRRALDALRRVPETRETLEQAVDLRFNLHDALLPLAEYSELRQWLREAEAIATTLDDQQRVGRAYSYLSHHAWIAVGDNDLAADYAVRALAIARAGGNRALEIVANFYLGQVGYSGGDLRTAVEVFARNAAALPATQLHGRFNTYYGVISRSWAALPYSELGEFEDGATMAGQALDIAEASGHTVDLAAACFGLGRLYLRRGEHQKAASALERGLAARHVTDLPQWFAPLASSLGSAYIMLGRLDEGLRLLEAAVETYEMKKMSGYQALWVLALGEGYLAAGKAGDAIARAASALDLSRSRSERSFEAWVLWLLGEALSRCQPIDAEETTGHYRQALALATELSMRPLVAHCNLGLGKLYTRTGNRRNAEEYLTTATSLFREMDMRFWLEQAEAVFKDVE